MKHLSKAFESRRRVVIRFLGWVVMASLIAGCGGSAGDNTIVPTVADINVLPTSIFLTENAPPAGFGQVTFDPIEARLNERRGWSYTITGSFDGTFDDSGEPATGILTIQVWANELGEARRVVLEVEGSALSPDELGRRIEGVRLSNDYFIVDTNGVCTVGGEGATVIADLSAGQVIGGVTTAVPTGHRAEIEGVPAWQYTFAYGNIRLPAIHRDSSSQVALEADLWIAPSLNAVLRMEMTMSVQAVRVLWSEQAVSGTLNLNYQLNMSDFDRQPNISVPHGC